MISFSALVNVSLNAVEAVTLVVIEQSLQLNLPRALFEAGMASCPAVFPSSHWVLATATISAAQFPLLFTRLGVQVGMPTLSSSFLPALITSSEACVV